MRIGSVPYLNARPLVDWLEHHTPSGVTLHYDIPSALIEQLLAGELDIAMASTLPTLEHDNLCLLDSLGVTCTGPALSVRLFSQVPIDQITSLALDASSRSSNALARVVLADGYHVIPNCLTLPPSLDQMLSRADAAVLIGDIGLSVQKERVTVLDLGAEWQQLTGLPFFFAGWVACDSAILASAAPMLLDALEHGLTRLDAIAGEEAERLHLPRDLCHHYLANVMRYHVGEAERAGLEEFRKRAMRLGLIEKG